MTIGWNDLNGSINQLATYNGGNTQATARSLMMMVQFTSEATRLNQVRGDILATTLSTVNPPSLFLPTRDLSLENNWGALSQYAVDVTNNSTIPPRTIGAAGTLSNFGEVATFLSTMLRVPAESTATKATTSCSQIWHCIRGRAGRTARRSVPEPGERSFLAGLRLRARPRSATLPGTDVPRAVVTRQFRPSGDFWFLCCVKVLDRLFTRE